jgi:hypothetical protein
MTRRALNISTGDVGLDRVMQPLHRQVQALADEPDASKATFRGIDLADGVDRRIPHGLEQKPVGWRVVDLYGAVTPGVIQRISWSSTELVLRASGYGATVVVNLEVY